MKRHITFVKVTQNFSIYGLYVVTFLKNLFVDHNNNDDM